MNRDFHLYGTYMAACIAGYVHEDALEIACAAQEVDDFYGDKALDSCPTVTGTGLSLFITFCTTYFTNHSKRVFKTTDTWMPFHFIPENAYNEREDQNISMALRCGYGEPMKQVCQHLIPGSSYYKSPVSNERIGITMHVLADSFAHKEYCGVLSYNPRIAENLKVKYGSVKAGYPNEDSLGTHVPVWMSGVLSGIFYFGHGSSGHVPDLSWALYCHQWKYDKEHTEVRDNTDLFLKAFSEMVHILRCAGKKEDSESRELITINQVEDFVKIACEKIRRDRSNGMDRNMAIDEAKMMVFNTLDHPYGSNYDQLIKYRYIRGDGVVSYKEETVGVLIKSPYYNLSLGVTSDNVFKECLLHMCGQAIVSTIDARYEKILKCESKLQDFGKAATAHKEAVYKAVGITRKDLRKKLTHDEFSRALRPAGIWDSEDSENDEA